MTNIQTVHVPLSQRSYDIEIGSGNLSTIGSFTAKLGKLTHAVVVTDSNVESPHARTCVDSLQATGAKVDLEVVPAGEATKSITVIGDLWQRMLALGADRKTVVVAVGGGVVGDLAGFLAASYARGLALAQPSARPQPHLVSRSIRFCRPTQKSLRDQGPFLLLRTSAA